MYKVEFKIKNENDENIIASYCVLKARDCDNYLRNQLKFVNDLKDYTNLKIEIIYKKVEQQS